MKYVGVKQVLKNVKEERVKIVYIADDSQTHITAELIQLCKEKNIKIKHVKTMNELGKKAGIDVGASCTAE
jgi:large subunit ribosomal protein L7A